MYCPLSDIGESCLFTLTLTLTPCGNARIVELPMILILGTNAPMILEYIPYDTEKNFPTILGKNAPVILSAIAPMILGTNSPNANPSLNTNSKIG